MTEFEKQLLETLKGIRRELVIINTKEEDKEGQRDIFALNDSIDDLRIRLNDMELSHPLHEEMQDVLKKKLIEFNSAILVGYVDL